MLIRCRNCDRSLKVPDSVAGKKIRCPGCQAVLQVPASPVQSPSQSSQRPSGQSSGISSSEQKPRDSGSDSPAPRTSRITGSEKSPARPQSSVDSQRRNESGNSSTGESLRSSGVRRSSGAEEKPAAEPRRSSSSTGNHDRGARRPAPVTRAAPQKPARGNSQRSRDRVENIGDYLDRKSSRADQDDADDFGSDYEDDEYSYDELDYNPFSAPESRFGVSAAPRSVNNNGTRLAGLGLLIHAAAWTLTLVTFAGIIVMLFAIGVMADGQFLKPTAWMRAMGAMTVLAMVLIFLLSLVFVVAPGLRMAVPENSGARGLAIAEFCCALAAMLLTFLSAAMEERSTAAGMLSLMSLAVRFSGAVLHVLSLRAFAIYLRRDDLRSRTKVLAVSYICLIGLFLLVFAGVFVAVAAIERPDNYTTGLIAISAGGLCLVGTYFVSALNIALMFSMGFAARQSSRR